MNIVAFTDGLDLLDVGRCELEPLAANLGVMETLMQCGLKFPGDGCLDLVNAGQP